MAIRSAYLPAILACCLATSSLCRAQAQSAEAKLVRVVSFAHQVTGVTVSEDGRIFVNFPRWTEDAPVSVAELGKDGSLTPYPDPDWNSWRNAKKDEVSPKDHFVCVQSVVADGRGSLWVLDPAAPNTEHIVKNGPKLVQIDLATNAVKRVIAFDESVAPEGSYLNDVRFSPDGRNAYITDSGAGALVVVDLTAGTGRRVLEKDPSTQPEPGVQVMTDGKPLQRPDGRAPAFAADGIALDPKGEFLYWQALTGKTLYRIATGALLDRNLSAEALAGKVEKVGTTEPVDGLWIDKQGRLFLTAFGENAVKLRLADGTLGVLAQDARLRWPDTFAEGPDGSLYVTNSAIQDSPWFHETGWTAKNFALWKIPAASIPAP